MSTGGEGKIHEELNYRKYKLDNYVQCDHLHI